MICNKTQNAHNPPLPPTLRSVPLYNVSTSLTPPPNMKGTISPELKAIMRNPEWRKKFMLAMDFPDDFTLELEPGVFVTIKRFHNM